MVIGRNPGKGDAPAHYALIGVHIEPDTTQGGTGGSTSQGGTGGIPPKVVHKKTNKTNQDNYSAVVARAVRTIGEGLSINAK